MDPLSGFDRDSVLVHELGHALRIKDHPNDGWDEYWRTRSIMYRDPTVTDFRTPRQHDKDDYHGQWG